MRRDLRELAALIVLGLVLGLGHLALRPDLPWFPTPRADEGLCGGGDADPAGFEPAPAASFAPDAPMSSPGPEDVP